jgi:hypothetical protein
MNKFNVGDKVRIKGDLSKCEFGCNCYMEWFVGKEAIVTSTFGKGIIKLDIDAQAWDWSENVLELIKENDNMNTKIEENKVNESDLKDSEISKEVKEKKGVEDKKNCKDCDYFVKSSLGNYCDFYGILLNIMHGCNEFQLKKHKEGIKDIKTENIENDPVNHPSHYTDGNIEVMDYIEDKGFNFALGNAVKYISRAGKKDKNKTIQDLEKAEWYLNREIKRLKKLQGK